MSVKVNLPSDWYSKCVRVGPHVSLHDEYLNRFVKKACEYPNTSIVLGKGRQIVDAKRSSGVYSLNVISEEEIFIAARGEDAKFVVDTLVKWINELEIEANKTG